MAGGMRVAPAHSRIRVTWLGLYIRFVMASVSHR
jgi:hypothetical protein